MGVIVGKGLVVVVDLGQIGVHEQVHEPLGAAAGLELELAVVLDYPAAVPLALVLPVLGIADPGLGLDVVEPHVLHPDAVGPDVLAGHRTGMAADALVQVHDHGEIGADLHQATSFSIKLALRPPPLSSPLLRGREGVGVSPLLRGRVGVGVIPVGFNCNSRSRVSGRSSQSMALSSTLWSTTYSSRCDPTV